MPHFEHILFPVDFSENCRAVRPFVRSIAEKSGAKVTLMHVVEALYSKVNLTGTVMLDVETAMRRDGEQKLAEFWEDSKGSLPAGWAEAVLVGDPAGEIVEYARKNRVDLIMMPTHGWGTFRRLLIGSVTAKVLYDAVCPVWTAAHTEDVSLPAHAKCENILCAVDLGRDDIHTMRSALDLARHYGANLRFVHAIPPAEPYLEGLEDSFLDSTIKLAHQELARMQKEAGTDLSACVKVGTIPAAVREAALQQNADLVVIGRGKLYKHLGRLRTNAYAIIRDSPCPVLSF